MSYSFVNYVNSDSFDSNGHMSTLNGLCCCMVDRIPPIRI